MTAATPASPAAGPASAPGTERPLRIGMSARLMHRPPAELGFRHRTLQYLEQSMAHWLMAHGAVALMVPALGYDAEVSRRQVVVRHYVDLLDGLVLQGGADVSPGSYGQRPLREDWSGDPVRDHYEIELLEGFLTRGKPVLGVCRGAQLINVAFGGSLWQDIATQCPGARAHVDPVLYDELHHAVRFPEGGWLSRLHGDAQEAQVTSIHHQAIDRLGSDLQVEARSAEDGVVEAIRARGSAYVAGLQWHPEFHPGRAFLLDCTPILEDFLAAAAQRRHALESSSPGAGARC